MKLSITVSVATAWLFATPCSAWDEAHLAKLKETGQCAGCDLSGADLRWANVYAAELGGAPNLVDAVLDGANLSNANLYGGNLEGASLKNANLAGANMSWGSLIGADLSNADITDTKMTGAIFCNTVMPDGEKLSTGC